jgi:hypothetical protein
VKVHYQLPIPGEVGRLNHKGKLAGGFVSLEFDWAGVGWDVVGGAVVFEDVEDVINAEFDSSADWGFQTIVTPTIKQTPSIVPLRVRAWVSNLARASLRDVVVV